MGGIATAGGGGMFSGLDTASIIEQLMAIEARPKSLIQKRIAQIQVQQGGFLDLNSKLQALKTAAESFRTKKTFQLKSATSSNEDVLKATADTTAAPGSFTFLVDRLVSSQQSLSRGFTDRDLTGAGASSFTFESARARLDSDVALADLNNGQGVARGKITITDSGNRSATVDLSRAVTVGDVLEAINGNGVAQVTASVSQGKLVIKDNSSTTTAPIVADAVGYTTATSLGLTTASTTASGTRTGATIYALNANTTLNAFNDRTGVQVKNAVGTGANSFNIKVTLNGTTTTIKVNIGDKYEDQNGSNVKVAAAVSTAGGVITRINEALAANGATSTVSASIDATNGRLVLSDSQGTRTLEVVEDAALGANTARDLGLLSGPTVGTINGRRILAGLNSTLTSSLNGGSGIAGDGELEISLRNGSTFTANVAGATTIDQVISTIEANSGNRVRVSLNDQGTGLTLTDLTSGSSNLIITGSPGADTATALGLSTGASGVASNTLKGTSLQKKYISEKTLLADNPLKRAIGTGEFRITDSTGVSKSFRLTESMKSFADVIKLVNDGNLKAKARINAKGDGLEIYEDNSTTPAGTQKIKVEDVSGVVAKNLNIAGTATATGVDNKLDGSFEKKVTFGVGDTLQQVADKINAAGLGVSAAVIRDGSGATPYRLALSSGLAGREGRFLVDTGTFDLGLSTLDAGEDAKMFFGSTDPARAVAVTRSSNSFDDVIPGVKLDATSVSEDPITIAIASDREEIVTEIKTFISAFNTVTNRIDELTKYNIETKKGGALLGDATSITLRSSLYNLISAPPQNVASSFTRLTQVGVTIGSGGDLELDEDRLRAALEEDASGVEALFAARVQNAVETEEEIMPGITVRNTNAGTTFSSLGMMGMIEELAKKYLDSTNGVFTTKSKSFTDLIAAQNKRITELDVKLASKRTKLERQFTQMELAISKLQSQQSALGSLGG